VARLTHLTTDQIRGHRFRYKSLKKSEALKNGAEIVSEGIVLGAAMAVTLFEFARTNAKKKENDNKERQRLNDYEARLSTQAAQLAAVDAMLRENQRILEDLHLAIARIDQRRKDQPADDKDASS